MPSSLLLDYLENQLLFHSFSISLDKTFISCCLLYLVCFFFHLSDVFSRQSVIWLSQKLNSRTSIAFMNVCSYLCLIILFFINNESSLKHVSATQNRPLHHSDARVPQSTPVLRTQLRSLFSVTSSDNN